MVNKTEISDIQFVPPQTKIHTFMDVLSEKDILFQVIKLKNSVLIYINNKDQMVFNNMVVAVDTKYSDIPQCTTMMNSFVGTGENSMVCRLSKKLEKPVYLSFNLEEDKSLLPLVESRLVTEFQKYPEKF